LQESALAVDLSKIISDLTKHTTDLEEGLLISATYDGDLRVVVLKFYDPKNERFWLWYDRSGHKPYCFTKLPMEELNEIKKREDIIGIEEVEKQDLLRDEKVIVRKIVAKDPLAIGGSQNSVRDQITAWEADIKYYENYAYDKGLKIGTYYSIRNSEVIPLQKEVAPSVVRSLDNILAKNSPEFVEHIKTWAELLGQPLVEFKRIAIDIEVDSEENRLPDPEKADRQLLAVSFYNEREKLVYLVKRSGRDLASELDESKPKILLFDDEAKLIREVFRKILEYPFLITFNGDDFDLKYLRHRAQRLNIKDEENPIQLQRQEASLKHGVHLDLYRTFNNKSIQVYAYGNKYSEHTLNGVAEGILGKSKMEFEGSINDLPLNQLAEYCLNDYQLTYELTSNSGSALMKLLLVLSRVGRMPINDLARLGVSNWIRSMLFYEHRRVGALIPRGDELAEKGGASSEAIIKGKKYKGGLVIEPKPGVHFDVSVLDFASLYPSLIKVYNLSYDTVNCPHEECRTNLIPGLPHWVCKRRKGITSIIIGSLRDLRVSHYKPLAKDRTLGPNERELYNIVSQGLKVFLNACFTGDTYVITPDGIKNIKSVSHGDRVVNVNPDNQTIEIDTVIDVQQFPYCGEMYHFRDKRFLDLVVTPNHRFLTVDKRIGNPSGTAFRAAEEVFLRTNMSIPRIRSGVRVEAPPARISLLDNAKKLGAIANLYPGEKRRLSNWFRTLPPQLRIKIREQARVDKNRSKIVDELRSHYRLPASELSEADIDAVEAAGGFVLLGKEMGSKVPARYDPSDFASFCGWFVSEGNLHFTGEKFYSTGAHRGNIWSMQISQSQGKGNTMGFQYRAEVKQLLARLGLQFCTDSLDKKCIQVSSHLLYDWFVSNCYVAGVTRHVAEAKRVPDFVFASYQTMEAYFESAYKGDGSRRDKKYSTKSSKLAEDMAVLLTLLGFKAKIRFDVNDSIYRVIYSNMGVKLTRAAGEKHQYVKKEEYNGTVYCVTTAKNHTVIAGRNGKFVPVGQSYGVFGFATFALYCLPVAEATAALGRYAITKTIDRCKELGVDVVYSDTDSLFLQNPSKEQIDAVIQSAEITLGVELDLDKQYRYVAFSARKKNYFGVLPDGTPDIKGLTGRKSQTPEFLKKTFYDALNILGEVQTATDFERARNSIRDLLTKTVSSLKHKEIPVSDLAFNVMIGKPSGSFSKTTPQHVKAAKLLEEKGRNIKAGDIISFVKTRTPPYVKPAELARPDEIDVDKYLDYARSMFDQVLDALGFSFDEIMGSTTLDLFWT
jgi:DNA polymerase elongation subunit (family B)